MQMVETLKLKRSIKADVKIAVQVARSVLSDMTAFDKATSSRLLSIIDSNMSLTPQENGYFKSAMVKYADKVSSLGTRQVVSVHQNHVVLTHPTSKLKRVAFSLDASPNGDSLIVQRSKKAVRRLGHFGIEFPAFNSKRVSLDSKGKFAITFPRTDKKTMRDIKTITGRKWDPKNMVWRSPATLDAADDLRKWGFAFSDDLDDWYESITLYEDPAKLSMDLPADLRDYQDEGVRFIESRHGKVLLADDMGLGKTRQVIEWWFQHPEVSPFVVVCPASLKWNWYAEFHKWLHKPTIYLFEGYPSKKPNLEDYRICGDGSDPIYIVNYDILADRTKQDPKTKNKKKRVKIPRSGWLHWLKKLKPNLVALDESHYCRNPKTHRTKSASSLVAGVPHVIAMTGTPMDSKPSELFPVLKMISPERFPAFFRFGHRYCDPKHNGFGWEFKGATNSKELHEKLVSTIMLRRRKKDVLTELPAKQRFVVPIRIADDSAFRKAEDNFLGWLGDIPKAQMEGIKKAEALVKMTTLKRLAGEAKLEAAIKWVGDFLDNDEKLVLFVIHKKIVKALQKAFPKAVTIDGSTQARERQRAVDEFQENDKVRLLIGNLDAASVGLTLTAASNTAFLEFGWSPSQHDQAEDRVHRIGQLADSVNAWYLTALDSIDEQIMAGLDTKMQKISKIIDGEVVEEDDLLLEILDQARVAMAA